MWNVYIPSTYVKLSRAYINDTERPQIKNGQLLTLFN